MRASSLYAFADIVASANLHKLHLLHASNEKWSTQRPTNKALHRKNALRMQHLCMCKPSGGYYTHAGSWHPQDLFDSSETGCHLAIYQALAMSSSKPSFFSVTLAFSSTKLVTLSSVTMASISLMRRRSA